MMRPISDAMLTALSGSHTMAVGVRVCEPGQTGTDPVGDMLGIVESGDVRFDATADVWAEAGLTVTVDQWDSRAGFHPVQPYGNELFVERGIDFGGNLTQMVPLGYYKLSSVVEEQAGSNVLQVQATDRMQPIIEGILTRPVQFAAATSVGAAFAQLVQEIHPSGLIEFADPAVFSANIGRKVVVEEDRYAFLRQLATAHGQIMYYDHRGILVVKPPPPITEPVWDVEAGPDGVLVSSSRAIDREGVYNAVAVKGEGGDDVPPVNVVVIDSNPDSPTYYNGPYGKVPLSYSSSLVTAWTQANAAGRALLERLLGLPHYADFTAIPNPALEPFDPVRVRYTTHHARETHVISTVTVPLVATEPLTASTRESSKVLISTDTGEGEV